MGWIFVIPVLIAEGIEKEQTEVRCWDGWDPRIHPPTHTYTVGQSWAVGKMGGVEGLTVEGNGRSQVVYAT